MKLVQIIRLIDVFYIGIFLIYVALKFTLPPAIKFQLIMLGTATILYNAYRFVKAYRNSENDISVVSSYTEPLYDIAA